MKTANYKYSFAFHSKDSNHAKLFVEQEKMLTK